MHFGSGQVIAPATRTRTLAGITPMWQGQRNWPPPVSQSRRSLMNRIAALATATALIETSLKSRFKQAAIFAATFLALTYVGSPPKAAEPAPDPAGFDILGMKLGMSVEEIQAAIKACDPSLKIILAKSGAM